MPRQRPPSSTYSGECRALRRRLPAMARPILTLMFGTDLPVNIDHDGNFDPPDDPNNIVIERYRRPTPRTFKHGNRSMVGYEVIQDFADVGEIALDEIPMTYKREYANARKAWARFATWATRQGAKLDSPRLYFVPDEA